MKSNRHFIKDSVQNPIYIGASLAVCFLMLLFSPLVIQGSSLNDDSGDSSQQITYLSANDILSDIHYFLHLPSEGDSPEEQENESENESNKTLDEDNEHFTVNTAFFSKLGYNLEKSLFSQLNLSNHNRSRISLIILHHSWKSFLI
ncbi:hypothetical protein Q4534_17805 [Cyclobacterium sp. 1_MG-2023]|uniref:hypothetical protein n=1 Tax=Cyclobacterium sp. 1_MG-2023 TaxID=3062681 RepID=UPI0026E2C8DF|nr:hypothetical protein [Cyclobacterium sp. 1_MG-2023]MDO6439283.1 hypothetical protein [Cyclobacterium sp. 1_MG-2023]